MLSLLLAWLTYVLVENPIRFNRPLATAVPSSIALGVLVLAASTGLALTLRSVSVAELESDVHQRYQAASDDLPEIYASGCQADFQTIEPPNCVFGVKGASTTVVLFGDSHAAQLLPALQLLAERENWQAVLLTKSSCASMSYTPFSSKLGRLYVECDKWRERAFERIDALQPTVTIVANATYYVSGPENQSGLDTAGWAHATQTTLNRLRDSSATTVVIKDTPQLKFNGPVCLSRAAWRGLDPSRACRFEPNSRISNAVFGVEAELAAQSDRAYILDMTDAICPSVPCTIERDGLVLYRDFHHLTVSFATHLSDALYKRLKPIVERARRIQQNVRRENNS
jgi:hypothetical protein